MTALVAGAPSNAGLKWKQINWSVVRTHVYQLQTRTAKAIRENRWNKAKALQHLLTRLFAAKLLAIKMVISNKGSRTPGIDRVKWKTPRQRWLAAIALQSRIPCTTFTSNKHTQKERSYPAFGYSHVTR